MCRCGLSGGERFYDESSAGAVCGIFYGFVIITHYRACGSMCVCAGELVLRLTTRSFRRAHKNALARHARRARSPFFSLRNKIYKASPFVSRLARVWRFLLSRQHILSHPHKSLMQNTNKPTI